MDRSHRRHSLLLYIREYHLASDPLLLSLFCVFSFLAVSPVRSVSTLGMEGLEAEVLEFLATMADFVEVPVPITRLSIPSSSRDVVPVPIDRVYPPALSSPHANLKRRRVIPLGVNSKAPDRKKVVLFPASDRFKGVQCITSYVSLLQGPSKWRKPARDTKSMQCDCTSMVSCTHNN